MHAITVFEPVKILKWPCLYTIKQCADNQNKDCQANIISIIGTYAITIVLDAEHKTS